MTHKAILIDPQTRTVTMVDQEPGLQQLYDRLSIQEDRPCRDINAVGVTHVDAMYVDGEGMLFENMPMFTFVGTDQPFAGKGLIVGMDRSGEDAATTLTVEQVQPRVVWLELQTTGNLGPSGEVTPPPGFDFAYKVGDPQLKDVDQ